MGIDQSTEASRKLDRLLALTLMELTIKAKELPQMRGFERLANLSGSIVNDIDKQCNEVADQLESVQARGQEVVKRFKAFADDVKSKADEAENALRQLTNMPDPT